MPPPETSVDLSRCRQSVTCPCVLLAQPPPHPPPHQHRRMPQLAATASSPLEPSTCNLPCFAFAPVSARFRPTKLFRASPHHRFLCTPSPSSPQVLCASFCPAAQCSPLPLPACPLGSLTPKPGSFHVAPTPPCSTPLSRCLLWPPCAPDLGVWVCAPQNECLLPHLYPWADC